MEDQATAPAESNSSVPPQGSENQESNLEALTSEQIQLVRESLVKKLNEAHIAYLNVVMNLPINPTLKNDVLKWVDTGYLWAKEGIVVSQFGRVPTKPEPPTPPDANNTPPLDDAA